MSFQTLILIKDQFFHVHSTTHRTPDIKVTLTPSNKDVQDQRISFIRHINSASYYSIFHPHVFPTLINQVSCMSFLHSSPLTTAQSRFRPCVPFTTFCSSAVQILSFSISICRPSLQSVDVRGVAGQAELSCHINYKSKNETKTYYSQ